jgi:hypothetical protein
VLALWYNSFGHAVSVQEKFFEGGKMKEKSQSVGLGRAETRFVKLRMWKGCVALQWVLMMAS